MKFSALKEIDIELVLLLYNSLSESNNNVTSVIAL